MCICVCACVRACVRACCVRACVRVCACVSVCVCVKYTNQSLQTAVIFITAICTERNNELSAIIHQATFESILSMSYRFQTLKRWLINIKGHFLVQCSTEKKYIVVPRILFPRINIHGPFMTCLHMGTRLASSSLSWSS